MDIAAFQSLYPEEVRIQMGRTSWLGKDLEYYDASQKKWQPMANEAEALMFSEKIMGFDMVDGLIKSSILIEKELAIIIEGDLIAFVRGRQIKPQNDEDMNIDIDWSLPQPEQSYESVDPFDVTEDLKNLY